MEVLGTIFKGKREDVQKIEALIPLRHMSLNRNVCGLRRCLGIGYSDKELPLEETTFLDHRDIGSPKD